MHKELRLMHPVLLKAGILFFLLTSFFSVVGLWTGQLNSPDERSTFFFIRQFVRVGDFRIAEPLNVIAEDLIHPRAVNIVRHDLVPGSFLGALLLYGGIAKIFGMWIVFFLTPLIATIALFFFYRFLQNIFSKRIAFWSTLLLMIHPAWFYYTSRSLFPNVLFLSLLIIGFFFLVHNIHYIRYIFISSLFIGAALTIRTSEAGWVLGALFILWLLVRRSVPLWVPFLFAAGVALTFLPIFYENTQLYGNPFYNGYAQIDSEAIPASFAWHFESKILSTIFSLLLPFGFKPMTILSNANLYLLWLFWWFSIPTIFGLVIVFRKQITSYQLPVTSYVYIYLFMTLWLLLFYGSWSFRDSLLSGPTLGTSYTRYWLPVYVFGLPFVVMTCLKLFEVAQSGSRWIVGRYRALRIVIAFLVLFSFSYAFFLTGESLIPVMRTLKKARGIKTTVLQKTESNAVIIAERSDKIFFPERQVIFNDPLDERKLHRVIAKLVRRVPVYYFTELGERDIDFMNQEKLRQYGIAFGKGEPMNDHALYRLTILQKEKRP